MAKNEALENAVNVFQYQWGEEEGLQIICVPSSVGLAAPEGAYDSLDQNAECISVMVFKDELLASGKRLPAKFMGFPVVVLAI